MTLDRLLDLLDAPMRSANELELQTAIADVLTTASVPYEREARLSGPDRVDFLVELTQKRECSSCSGTGDYADAFTGLTIDCAQCDGKGWWPDRLRVAIEVKVQGGVTEIERQLARYAEHDSVDVVVLLSTRMQHARMPRKLAGKRVVTLIKADAALL